MSSALLYVQKSGGPDKCGTFICRKNAIISLPSINYNDIRVHCITVLLNIAI